MRMDYSRQQVVSNVYNAKLLHKLRLTVSHIPFFLRMAYIALISRHEFFPSILQCTCDKDYLGG
jgi:hypothetical protein